MINIVKQMSVQLGMMKYLKETLRHEAAVGSRRARSRGGRAPSLWLFTEDWANIKRKYQ